MNVPFTTKKHIYMYKFHTHYNKMGTNTTLRNTLSCWLDSSLDHGRHDNPLIVSGEVYPNPPPGTAVPPAGTPGRAHPQALFCPAPAPQHGPPPPAPAAALSPAAMSASVPYLPQSSAGGGGWVPCPIARSRGCARQHSLFPRPGAPPWRPHVVHHPPRPP